MPTKQERTTVAKLMLIVANAMDESRKEITEHADGERRPEYTLEHLRPMAKEALEEAQAMLASWGR